MSETHLPLIKGILFDFDGTLMDSLVCFHHIINLILIEESKPPITLEALRPHADKGSMAVINEFFQIDETSIKAKQLQQRFYEHWLGQMTLKTRFFPQAEQLLQTLVQMALPWGVVSNRPTRFALPLIEHFTVYQQASCLIWGDTLSHCKPDPMQLQAACEQLQLHPNSVLYVGDTENDMIAAHSAGMPFALAEYGYMRAESDSSSLNTELRIPHIKDLLPALNLTMQK